MQKKIVDAVYDDDLLDFFESLGIRNKFLYGKLVCAFCGDIINWDNLHSIFPDSGAIKQCCTKPDCVNNLIAKLQD